MSLGIGIPSRDFTNEDVFSSLIMSTQSSTHSSQTNTVGPAMSLRTSCWLLPQNEQYSVFLLSLAPPLLISKLRRQFVLPNANFPRDFDREQSEHDCCMIAMALLHRPRAMRVLQISTAAGVLRA